jgi:hypothetical protein
MLLFQPPQLNHLNLVENREQSLGFSPFMLLNGSQRPHEKISVSSATYLALLGSFRSGTEVAPRTQ